MEIWKANLERNFPQTKKTHRSDSDVQVEMRRPIKRLLRSEWTPEENAGSAPGSTGPWKPKRCLKKRLLMKECDVKQRNRSLGGRVEGSGHAVLSCNFGKNYFEPFWESTVNTGESNGFKSDQSERHAAPMTSQQTVNEGLNLWNHNWLYVEGCNYNIIHRLCQWHHNNRH